MNMLNFLVFSKDRACQLDLLLRSIDKFYVEDKLNYFISILYTSSSESHEDAYTLCKNNFIKHSNISFIKEQNFSFDTNLILSYQASNVCLLTDDTVFFRPFSLPFSLKDNETFSWRLGYNTFVQDCHRNSCQPYLFPDELRINTISWNPSKYDPWFNYGYPFSFDGHIYNRKFLADIVKTISFKSTNELEGGLHNKRENIQKITCNLHSSCVNIPCNNLSGLTDSGKFYSYSTEQLKQMFLSGKRIKLISESKTPIIGCHQELEFKFYDN